VSEVLLVGVDGSPSSARAAEFAAARATAAEGGHIVVAHVIDWSPFSPTTAEDNERRHVTRQQEIDKAQSEIVAPIVDRLQTGGCDVSTAVRHGHPAQTLVDLAAEHDAAHLIIGRTGESLLKARIFGSLPMSLVQISPIPVTVVP